MWIQSKILKFLVGCYRQRRPSWIKTPYFTAAITHHRIKIFNWFKLHMNCTIVFLCITDQFFDNLFRNKIMEFAKFNTSWRTFFHKKKFIFIFLIKLSKKWSVMHFMTISSTYLPNIIALWQKLFKFSPQ